jgi:hypothetical protein
MSAPRSRSGGKRISTVFRSSASFGPVAAGTTSVAPEKDHCDAATYSSPGPPGTVSYTSPTLVQLPARARHLNAGGRELPFSLQEREIDL